MALCRVFLPKSTLPIYRIGFSTVKVGLCSSLCPNSDSEEALQLTEDVGEPKRGVAAEPEPFVTESIETRPDIIFKATSFRNEAMLGANQPRIYHNIDASANVDHTASMSIESNNMPMPYHENCEFHDVKSTTKPEDAATFIEQNTSVKHGMQFIVEANSADVVNSEVLEVNQMHDFPHALASEGREDTCDTKSMPKIIASLNSVENNCKATTQSNDSELIDKVTGVLERYEVSSTMFGKRNGFLILNQEDSSRPWVVDKESNEEDTTSTKENSSNIVQMEKNDKTISNMPLYSGSYRGVLSAVYEGPETVVFKGGESSLLSNFTQKIFNSENVDMRSVNDQIIEETVKPTSLAFSPFEHSDEPCEEDADKRSDIKGLIDFIKFHKGVPSNAEIDNKCADLVRENLSDSKSPRSAYKDQLASSDFATVKPEIECEGPDVFEAIQSFGASETKETLDIQNPIKDTCPRRSLYNLFDSGSDPNSDSWGSVHGDSLTLLDSMTVESRMQDEEICKSDFRSFDCEVLKTSMEIPISGRNGAENLKNKLLDAKKLNENKMLVRFLRKNVVESEILETFQSYGKISKIEVSDGGFFKSAYIYFEERQGLQKAMKQTEIILKYGLVTMESATLEDDLKEKLSVPCLICDPDVPIALIKNPIRTVKIQHLTSDMSLHHIEEALSFCKSNISGCFFGTSNSTAFIEFETEVGKERALAKHAINVLGRQLVMLRIDVPRTTVARISNFKATSKMQIISLCRSVGAVRIPLSRSPDVLDAHYKVSEWPNMCNILNRLNGFEVEGRRLRAESARVFPPDILKAVWCQKEERMHLKTAGMELLRRLRGKMVDEPELVSFKNILSDQIFYQ